MTDEEKKRDSEEKKNRWKNKTSEQKQKDLERLFKGRSKFYENISEEEKHQRIINLNKGKELYLLNRDQEEIDRVANLKREKMLNIPNDKKRARIENQSKKMKSHIENLSEEDREEWFGRVLNSKGNMRNKSPEEQKEQLKLLHEGYYKWWNNISEEDKTIWANKISLGLRRFWASPESDILRELLSDKTKGYYYSLTEEEKEFHIRGIKNYYNQLSPEGKEEYAVIRSKFMKKYWNELPEEERLVRVKISIDNITKWVKNLTRDSFQTLMYESAINYNENPYTENPSKNELSFMDILDNNCIKFRYCYYNIEKHKDFDKLFPINPITGSDKVSAYHKWDFIIYTKEKDILVDVDGGVHDNKQLLSDKIKPNTRETIDFRDSKRPYQTDGLDAYIIKCYNDKISDNTPVENIKTKEEITFKQFMSLINLMNFKKIFKRGS